VACAAWASPSHATPGIILCTGVAALRRCGLLGIGSPLPPVLMHGRGKPRPCGLVLLRRPIIINSFHRPQGTIAHCYGAARA